MSIRGSGPLLRSGLRAHRRIGHPLRSSRCRHVIGTPDGPRLKEDTNGDPSGDAGGAVRGEGTSTNTSAASAPRWARERPAVTTETQGPLSRAVELLAAGQWQPAHEIVQKDTSPLAAWLHGIVHILEGDLKNAQGWYRRADRAFPGAEAVQSEIAAARQAVEAEQTA